MKRIIPLMIIFCVLATGCMIGPNYKRPPLNVPSAYEGLTAGQAAAQKASLGNEKWWEVFQDRTLQRLIHTALNQNFDLRVAADHVLEAQAQLNTYNSYEYPTVTAGAGPGYQRTEQINSAAASSWGFYQVNAAVSWDLDFWGKYRRMIEAAKANMLASQWARQEVVSTLIADVAGAYFQLRELDLELKISKETMSARQDSLQLTQQMADHGAASMLDVSQSQQLLYTASENVPDLERRIQQQENLISILVGNDPGPVARGLSLVDQPHAPMVPAGLPSSLLERRPDIREAEEQLVAANAQIGVAKGAYFPDISLTGNEGTAAGGYESSALSKLFDGPSGFVNLAGTLTQPIFNAGRLKAGVKLAKAQQDEALNLYRKTIQEAFREVSDALVAYSKTQEFTDQQSLLTRSAKDAARLSELLYKGGSASYLQVLESNTAYYNAELQLARSRLSELQALVDLYKALGGGWEQK